LNPSITTSLEFCYRNVESLCYFRSFELQHSSSVRGKALCLSWNSCLLFSSLCSHCFCIHHSL